MFNSTTVVVEMCVNVLRFTNHDLRPFSAIFYPYDLRKNGSNIIKIVSDEFEGIACDQYAYGMHGLGEFVIPIRIKRNSFWRRLGNEFWWGAISEYIYISKALRICYKIKWNYLDLSRGTQIFSYLLRFTAFGEFTIYDIRKWKFLTSTALRSTHDVLLLIF